MDTPVIRIRYTDTPDDFASLFLLPQSKQDEIKQRILDALHITRQEGESYLNAWLRVVHADNNIPYSIPANPRITEAILSSRDVSRFMWVLA